MNKLKRLVRSRSTLAFLTVLAVGAAFAHTGIVTTLNQKLLDACFEASRTLFPRPVRNDPVVVGINEKFLRQVDEPLALNHRYLARFLQAASSGNAQAIGVDIVLPEKRFDQIVLKRDPDISFHEILLGGIADTIQKTPVIFGKAWDEDLGHYRDIHVDYAAVLGMQGERIEAHASALLCRDSDARVRSYPGAACQPDRSERSFSGEIAAAAGVRQNWSGLVNYRLGGAYTYVPIGDVLDLAHKDDTARLRKMFEGRIVLLGAVLDETDLIDLPVPLAEWRPGKDRVPGILAHAQILRSMLNDGFIKPLPVIALWLGCLLGALFWFGQSGFRKTLLLGSVCMAMLALSFALLLQNVWLAPGALLCAAVLAFSARALRDSIGHFRDKMRLSRVFSGYVSPGVMDQIVSGNLDADQKSRRAMVCVLFSDIRNFTTMCEPMQPEEVVTLLNRYFDSMVRVVHRHGGTVDKFIGDGMMAFFGAPNALACPEQNALEAAQDMLRALDELNRQFAAEQRPPLEIGIGLHSGETVIGQIGSAERHEYTAIGDTVNVASRVEGLCKETGYPIVCSDQVARAVNYPPMLDNLGEKPIKGRSPLPVFGWKPGRQTP